MISLNNLAPYSPRMLRLIGHAAALRHDLMWIRGAGWFTVHPGHKTSTPHLMFTVEGNRLKLLPQKVKKT